MRVESKLRRTSFHFYELKLINRNHHVARFDDGVDFFAFGQIQAFRRIFRDNRDDFHAVWKFDDDLRINRAVFDWFDYSV